MAEREREFWSPERTGIVLGVTASMAGNVAWAVHRSPVLVGVGIGMSLVLPVAVRLWRASPAESGTYQWWERTLAMAGVCVGAAAYSVVHTTALLLNPRQVGVDPNEGLPWAIAWIPIVVVELLVVMSARAGQSRRDRGTRPSRDKRTPQVKPGTSRPVSAPRPRDTTPSASPAPSRSASPASPSAVPPDSGERPGPRPVPELPTSRPVPVPEPSTDPDDYAHLDEPIPDDESPEDRRRRLDRNKKRRLRAARKAEEEAS